MSAPDKIWVNPDDNTDGCCPVETDLDDVGKFFDVGQAVEYTRSDLIAASAVEVKPLDLSNMLKHAFIAGRISAGASSSFHGYAWAEYDPTESAAYARILSALHPASPLGAVAALVEDLRELREVVLHISGKDTLDRELIRAALTRIDAALAPFARKGE